MQMAKSRGIRQYVRAPFYGDVAYRVSDTTLHARIGNISLGGLFIFTPRPVPAGEAVQLQLSLPTQPDRPIEAAAVSRWTTDEEPTRAAQPGMGLEFIELRPADQDILKDFMLVAITAADEKE